MKIVRGVSAAAYLYLALPVIIFLIGWCKWYIGYPVAVLVGIGVFFSIREHSAERFCLHFTETEKRKLFLICVLVTLWVILSGIGNYVWQNSDHMARNTIFEVIVNNSWPVTYGLEADGVVQQRMLIYYIGYWLPAALVGKMFGIKAGYAMQAVWSVIGLLIVYAMICIRRKKIEIWPLLIFIFFSGLDVVGTVLIGDVEIWGTEHLEAWSWFYQYSSNTTLLFWVFNQAIPAWVASALVFLEEKPRNLIFTVSLLVLSAVFPAVGLLPFAIYYMIARAEWTTAVKNPLRLLMECGRNWASVQNILAGLLVGGITVVYLLSNEIMDGLVTGIGNRMYLLPLFVLAAIVAVWAGLYILLNYGVKLLKFLPLILTAMVWWRVESLSYDNWMSDPFLWVNLTLFFFLEAGVFLLCVYAEVQDKTLFWLNTILLYLIPTVYVGGSCDFCMRASVPGLFLLMLWCIQTLGKSRKTMRGYVLIALLLLGAVTPLHEIKRTYVNTRTYYENQKYNAEGDIFGNSNFSGSVDGLFGKYLAK